MISRVTGDRRHGFQGMASGSDARYTARPRARDTPDIWLHWRLAAISDRPPGNGDCAPGFPAEQIYPRPNDALHPENGRRQHPRIYRHNPRRFIAADHCSRRPCREAKGRIVLQNGRRIDDFPIKAYAILLSFGTAFLIGAGALLARDNWHCIRARSSQVDVVHAFIDRSTNERKPDATLADPEP